MARTREQILEHRRRLKEEYGKLFDDLTAILFRADPVGINFEVNPDEYQPEAGTILPRGLVNPTMKFAALCTKNLFSGLVQTTQDRRETIDRLRMKSGHCGRTGFNVSDVSPTAERERRDCHPERSQGPIKTLADSLQANAQVLRGKERRSG